MNLFKTLFLALAVSIFLVSCGNDYSTSPLTGKFNGTDWTIKSAKATTNPLDSNVYVIEFYNVVISEPCGVAEQASMISTTCPKQVGVHDFGMLKFRFAYFNTPNDALMANDGSVEILSIDVAKNEITGRMIAKYDDNNTVNGTFTAQICAENGLDNLMDQMENTLDTLKNTNDSIVSQ